MRIPLTILRSAAICSTLALNSCSHGIVESPLYLAVTINPRPTSLPVNGTAAFTATVSNGLSLPQWTLLDAADTPAAGALTTIAGSPSSISYTAPAAPPIYTNAVAAGFTQGTVTVQATVNPPAGTSLPVAHDSVTFFITAPTITAGISPASVAVPLGTTQLFSGYAVGNVDNAVTWQVNGVTGGSTAAGTITASGLYTAPATLPVTGSTVTVTVVSQADPTQSASALVTLQ